MAIHGRLGHRLLTDRNSLYSIRATLHQGLAIRALSTFQRSKTTDSTDGSFDPKALPTKSRARIVPESPSYFSAQPGFVDNLVHIQELLLKYEDLPTLPPSAVPRISWKTLMEYREQVGEEVRISRYSRVKRMLDRLNSIHPTVKPRAVVDVIESHRRPLDPSAVERRPEVIDKFGRAYANGRRKRGRANVLLVEGEGEVIVNGKSIAQYFARIHDRESALWPLKATERLDKYNVWATVHGGGTTGQAESMTLAVARALLVHEPALKPALRRAGCVTRDPRKVERKKPGHVKARKMPAWVAR